MADFATKQVLFGMLFVTGFISITPGAGAAVPTELNNEASITNEQIRLSADLPGTVVVRTNAATGQVDVLQLSEKLSGEAASQAAVVSRAGEFTSAESQDGTTGLSGQARSELDTDSSKNSWYFYFPHSSYYSYWPSYYYTGYSYNYSPYYHFFWGGYGYSYYRWYR